ncbi:MAG: adenylyl-sulfate kinase [Patescibacteria group bacterium]
MSENEKQAGQCGKCGAQHPSEECKSKDVWDEATEFWNQQAVDSREVADGLHALGNYKVDTNKPETDEYGEPHPNFLVMLARTKEEAENFAKPTTPERPAFGAMPYYDKRFDVVARFPDEARFFQKHYKLGDYSDRLYANGAILFELKFGRPLSEFTKEILEQYPDLGTGEGQNITLFGLSGCGKSTVLEVLKEKLGEQAIAMDSDTIRYGLFAKLVKDAEATKGNGVGEIKKQSLIHNDISGSLYLMQSYLTRELKARGYTVVTSGVTPAQGADKTIYIEHPDGIEPTQVEDEDVIAVSKNLFERTKARVGDVDDYDWEHAETIIDFNKMVPVTVQVPEHVHAMFVRKLKKVLGDGHRRISHLENPYVADEEMRKDRIRKQLDQLLG